MRDFDMTGTPGMLISRLKLNYRKNDIDIYFANKKGIVRCSMMQMYGS